MRQITLTLTETQVRQLAEMAEAAYYDAATGHARLLRNRAYLRRGVAADSTARVAAAYALYECLTDAEYQTLLAEEV